MERLIKIGSVTLASRARRELLKEAIPTRLTKAESSRDGCVWGLRVKNEQLLDAKATLSRLGYSYELI